MQNIAIQALLKKYHSSIIGIIPKPSGPFH